MERVLVVDDEESIVKFLAEALRRKGYTVDVVLRPRVLLDTR